MGKCQCQFSLTMAEVGGAGRGVGVGLKKNSSQTILRLVWGHWMLTKSPSSAPSLPPNLIRVHPKLTSQTDHALSLTIKSTLRPNESTLYQEQPLTISTYDHHTDKGIPSLYQRIYWLFKVDYTAKVSYSVAHHEVIFSIHFPKRENKWVWLKAASFWKLSRNNVSPCNYSG